MKLLIEYDHGCDAPHKNSDGAWTPYSFNSRHYNFKHPSEFFSPLSIGLRRKLQVGLAFVLSYHEHGSCIWALQNEAPQCQWDTTGVAGILIWEHKPCDMGAKTYKDRQEDARLALREYTDWCNGQCFGYILKTNKGDCVDSCWGFIGRDCLLDCLSDNHPELFKSKSCREFKPIVQVIGEAREVVL